LEIAFHGQKKFDKREKNTRGSALCAAAGVFKFLPFNKNSAMTAIIRMDERK
jgi:hypothetical protein